MQFYIAVEKEEWKLDTLCDLYVTLATRVALVFCCTNRQVDFLADQMTKRDLWPISTLHDELDQKERDLVMRELRSSGNLVLIGTDDLISRGIDVQQVAFVVNYDMPDAMDTYLHRLGRCGRFGRRGIAITFVTPSKVAALKDIEEHFGTHIDELPMDFTGLV